MFDASILLSVIKLNLSSKAVLSFKQSIHRIKSLRPLYLTPAFEHMDNTHLWVHFKFLVKILNNKFIGHLPVDRPVLNKH